MLTRITLTLIILALATVAATAAETKTFTVTAYCACKTCCGKWSGGPTASGLMPRQGVTVAGPRSYKLGTVVRIEGLGRRIIQDRLAKKYDSRIDVFFTSHIEALRFGKKQLQVTIEEAK